MCLIFEVLVFVFLLKKYLKVVNLGERERESWGFGGRCYIFLGKSDIGFYIVFMEIFVLVMFV